LRRRTEGAGSVTPLHPIKEYEELDGGQGREVFFRPHRYRAAELAPLTGSIEVGNARCPLVDVSQNGVAFEWPKDSAPLATGDMLPSLTLRFDEYVVYQGAARVGSVREQDSVLIAGVSFEDQFIDIDDVVQLRTIKSWAGRDGRGLSIAQRPWSVAGCAEVKAQLTDLALYFEDAERQLNDLEKQLAWHVVQGGAPSPSHTALVERVKRDFSAEVVRASDSIDAAVREVPAAHRRPLQEYSLRLLDAYLMQAPWMHRARTKPFGYPGDYEVMRFVYERDFEGSTLFAKALGHGFLQTKAALAVKYRKDLIKNQLRHLLDVRGPSERPIRILSIAAGPAQELFELFSEIEELQAPLQVVLFDQDKGALSCAYRRLKPLVETKFPGRVQILYLNESIKRLLRDAHLFETFGLFDAIYSCGLFDYLQTSTSVILARNLYSRLTPTGKLYIANMAPENPSRWFMEMHLDWILIHRTRAELTDIGVRAAPQASVRVLEEEAGVNPFIELQSP
jgi:hypothetical protein